MTFTSAFDRTRFEQEGFAVTSALLSGLEIAELVGLLEANPAPADSGPRRGGVRDVLDLMPQLRALAAHPAVTAIVEEVLGPGAFVVRATLFDKTGEANWKVPWHQDLTIAVAGRLETPGFGPWSLKSGVQHVQPTTEVLERMVTVRIHLDDCPGSNGALRVIPGTHRLGRLNQNHMQEYVNEERAVTCEALAGEALVMRPLLLHASGAASSPSHRRVMHFDYTVGELPDGLQWRMTT